MPMKKRIFKKSNKEILIKPTITQNLRTSPIRLHLLRQNLLPTERTRDLPTSRDLRLTRPSMLTLEAQKVENATHADGVKTRHHLRDTGVVIVLLEANRAVETLLKAKERALG